jgi:opacity protein-like surface antigen
MKKKLFAVALLSALTVPAFAADSGTYVFVDYGQLSFTNSSGMSSPGKFGIGAGYNFSANLGAELSYQINGNSTGSGTSSGAAWSTTAQTSSIVAAAVGNYPINDQFGVFAKLGASANSMKVDTTVPSFPSASSSNSYSNTDLYYAAGAKYNVSKTIGVYLEYENFGAYQSGSNHSVGSATTLGLTYGF